MTRSTRFWMLAATALLATLFVLPLWHIALHAPQYPEGLGMTIWINTIAGDTPQDLGNINNLNHYIGMRPIVPDDVPAFRFMPWALGTLVGLGAAAALVARRALILAWLGGVTAFGIYGLVDFYRWGYDYGHNLDAETAIIKIPGMSYQPPVIGEKQILNFVAASWPDIGTWLALGAVACAIVALFVSRPAAARAHAPVRMTSRSPAAARG